MSVALLLLVAACGSNTHQALAKPSPNSTFPASGLTDYLNETHQWDLPKQQAIADGESFCTDLRRGSSVPQAMKPMQADWGNPSNSLMVAHIAARAEQHLCPDQHDTFDAWFSAFLKAPSTSSPSPAASSASKTAIAKYLSMFRGMELPQFSPQKISDAKLIAVGRKACTDLETHKPADVLTMLEHGKWSRGDGSDVIVYASGTLCPDQSNAVDAWTMDVLEAGPNGTD